MQYYCTAQQRQSGEAVTLIAPYEYVENINARIKFWAEHGKEIAEIKQSENCKNNWLEILDLMREKY